MNVKFGEADAMDMMHMIRRRRPRWAEKAVMDALSVAAASGARPGTVLDAAIRACDDPGALAPTAINFEKYWTAPEHRTAPAGRMLCVECMTRQPADAMRHTSNGWVCDSHEL